MGRSATAGLRFDMLTSMDVHEWFEANARNPNAPPPPENWLATGTSTYVMLPADGSLSAAELDRQLGEFVARHAPPLQLGFADVELGLMPVAELLGQSIGTFFLRDSGMSVSTVLLLLGGLVLGVACINYANLATARATGRARDVGLRKVVGARATQVMGQYLFEAALLTTMALAVALLSVALITPLLAASFGIDLRLSLFGGAAVWAMLVGLVAAVTLIAGAYPAFVLSRVRPVLGLRAGRVNIGPRFLATLLVGIQFTVASYLLIVVTVTHLQNEELEQTGLGVTSDPLLVLANNRAVTKVDPQTLRDELLRLPQVSAVGSMAWAPWTIYHILSLSRSPEETATERLIFRYIVGYDFFSAFEMPLLAGRVFDREHADRPVPQEVQNIVVDRALIEEFDLGSAAHAVGQIVYIPKRLTAGFGGTAAQPLRIVGVVETRPLAVMGSGPTSTIYTFAESLPMQIARISATDVSGALDEIDALWERLAPGFAIERRFVDDYFEQSYANFTRISQIFSGLALLALLISTIGLFAMALLVANRRAHEIGVRKTLGAGTGRMIAMLLRSFSAPVLAANVAAWPLAYIAARMYLDAFIYPMDLTPAPFIACLSFTVAIAWLVVGGQTWRAASLRPADVLRSE
jgi:putative ABC transport system permease protein